MVAMTSGDRHRYGVAVGGLGRELPLERVAQLSGLGTSANLRELVRRDTGLPPSTYRKQFRAAHAP
jgi:AraC-like DNA-binding protein